MSAFNSPSGTLLFGLADLPILWSASSANQSVDQSTTPIGQPASSVVGEETVAYQSNRFDLLGKDVFGLICQFLTFQFKVLQLCCVSRLFSSLPANAFTWDHLQLTRLLLDARNPRIQSMLAGLGSAQIGTIFSSKSALDPFHSPFIAPVSPFLYLTALQTCVIQITVPGQGDDVEQDQKLQQLITSSIHTLASVSPLLSSFSLWLFLGSSNTRLVRVQLPAQRSTYAAMLSSLLKLQSLTALELQMVSMNVREFRSLLGMPRLQHLCLELCTLVPASQPEIANTCLHSVTSPVFTNLRSVRLPWLSGVEASIVLNLLQPHMGHSLRCFGIGRQLTQSNFETIVSCLPRCLTALELGSSLVDLSLLPTAISPDSSGGALHLPNLTQLQWRLSKNVRQLNSSQFILQYSQQLQMLHLTVPDVPFMVWLLPICFQCSQLRSLELRYTEDRTPGFAATIIVQPIAEPSSSLPTLHFLHTLSIRLPAESWLTPVLIACPSAQQLCIQDSSHQQLQLTPDKLLSISNMCVRVERLMFEGFPPSVFAPAPTLTQDLDVLIPSSLLSGQAPLVFSCLEFFGIRTKASPTRKAGSSYSIQYLSALTHVLSLSPVLHTVHLDVKPSFVDMYVFASIKSLRCLHTQSRIPARFVATPHSSRHEVEHKIPSSSLQPLEHNDLRLKLMQFKTKRMFEDEDGREAFFAWLVSEQQGEQEQLSKTRQQ